MINPQPKPVREIDSAYRRWIKSLPCLVDKIGCILPIDPHHVIPDGGGKMGSKVDDSRCVPLCRLHHDQAERRDYFERHFRIDFEIAIQQLNARYRLETKPKRERKVRVKADRYFVLHSECGLKHWIRKGYFYCSKLRIQCRAPAG